MATQTDFWGEIQSEHIRTPVAILREQAALLGPKTQNLVEAKVKTEPWPGGEFRHSFNLVVPALGNHTYELFRVYNPMSLYPVKTDTSPSLKDEEEFKTWLRDKLSSPETKRIIANLIAQASGT
jgi:hypothetical protein